MDICRIIAWQFAEFLALDDYIKKVKFPFFMAEREGFEPSIRY